MVNNWDDAYQNGAYIPDADKYLPIWQYKAKTFRNSNRPKEVPYGPHKRQVVDLYQPATPKGLVVFVHGGYWHSMERHNFSHLAAGALEQGWAVAMPGYVLCPESSIPEITQQIAAAIDTVANQVDGPIHLTGHSAGGHLVSRMGCSDLSLASKERIKHILSISGVHDLRPLVHTDMNIDLGLTAETATAESPALLTPRGGFDLTCWVGANERPEFLRQNQLLANIWTSCGVSTRAIEEPEHNHFTIIESLEKADSALTRCLTQIKDY